MFLSAFVISKSGVSRYQYLRLNGESLMFMAQRVLPCDRHRKSDEILRRYGSMHATSSSTAFAFLDRLSRGNPDWSERCETRGGWIDSVAK